MVTPSKKSHSNGGGLHQPRICGRRRNHLDNGSSMASVPLGLELLHAISLDDPAFSLQSLSKLSVSQLFEVGLKLSRLLERTQAALFLASSVQASKMCVSDPSGAIKPTFSKLSLESGLKGAL